MLKTKTQFRLKQAISIILATALFLGSGWASAPIPSFAQDKAAVTAVNNMPVELNSSDISSQGRLVVKLSPGISPEAVAQSVQAELVRKGPLQFITLALEFGRMDEVMNKLKDFPGVLSVSPAQKMKISASAAAAAPAADTTIQDPYYARQWGLTQIEVPQAWALGATGKGITVAVVDTGVDSEHVDLRGNIVSGYNAITGRSGLSATLDNNGHGTHVAGIIAAQLNGTGIVGVAPQAKIMPIKAVDSTGEGTDDVIADGIVWAANHGAQIINLSLGADSEEAILKEAVRYALDQGCLIVAAGGNKDEENRLTTLTYPAADPEVLAVTATDEQDRLASFSLTGPGACLAAPGTNIVSDYWQKGAAGYAVSDGTSMASPFVAGTAALVWSQHPDFSASKVRQILEDSSLDLGTTGRDDTYGYGRVNAYWAVRFAAEPESFSASANVTWAGGILKNSSSQTSVQLEIPPRALGSDPSKTPLFKLSTPTVTANLPAGVKPIGEPISIEREDTAPVKKLLQLSMTPVSYAADSNRLQYIYRWTGSRWLKVGGGMTSGTVTVGITEQGIYQMGSAAMPEESRLAGEDRLDTAVQISQAGFPDGADTVLLAKAEDFPDALAGVPLAYKLHAPILLTNSASLSANVLTEIQRLQPKQVILLGGTGAISGSIEQELQNIYSVRRLGGANRYDTARQIALAMGMTGEAVLVNGSNFPDALAMSSIAAQYGVPILLTAANVLPAETNEVLGQSAMTATVVIGGEGVVSSDTMRNLPNPTRLSGQDRYATAAEVLKVFPPRGGAAFLATGENFPDALTGGVLASLNSSNLILVSSAGMRAEEQTVLQGWSGKKVFAFGGSSIVSDSIMTQVQTMLQ
ncbi:S8 family serine peptidase [Desulfitobacterium sp.]|uniref:S8 family serine peptidase n=1 Tax=Desulfitobacterium sp. TaxID=49981 RepID=UPI002B1F8914|nr:S8 family serine peptidase [Desulfitobacterium sp.]MEA4901438.1 S8 family serine peptidase [Desulfitobacterium sp.]